ncbi:hypothetical protein CNMCM8980_000873 [Aspergillus fumigatiaffinis]|nr:hypothetical protein CNMCM8980_000873 [Aspergillus fumigatiaffinis]
MKFSFHVLNLAVLFCLAPTIHTAPAPVSQPDDLPLPSGSAESSAQFMIDLSVVGTQLTPRDADTNVDHSLEAYNFFGDESWAIGIRPDRGPVWIHESRWKTLLEDSATISNATGEEEASSVEARQWYYPGGSYGYYGTFGYGYGYYGYYAKRDVAASCPAQSGPSSSSHCNPITNLADSVSMYASQLLLIHGYAPKMNVYYDIQCNSYMTSVIGSAACISSSNAIHGVITFNQAL